MARSSTTTLEEPPARRPAWSGHDALVASSKRLDPRDPDDTRNERARKLPWQPRAWQYYDEMGEVWFAHNYKANACRKARLVVAQPSDNPDEEPETLSPTTNDADVGQAYAELERMHGQSGSHSEILNSAALNISAVGEGYLTGWTPDDLDGEETWDFLSTDQVEVRSDGWIVREGPLAAQATGYRLKPSDFIARIWRRHPRWRNVADCEMRAVLTLCDELLIAQRAMRATDVSRVAGNGILIVAQGASFGPVNAAEVDEGDGNDDDPLNQDLIETMMTPIQDPDNAAAVVPLLLRMPDELCDDAHVRHLTFVRPHDDKALERITAKIERLANGLDIPAAVLTGMDKANHWSAWLVDDQCFAQHIEPLLTLIVTGFTSAFLRPALKARGIDKNYVVWYDATQIVKHPNQAQDAKDVFDRGELSGNSLRSHCGFTEKDAPTDEERAAWAGALAPGETPPPGPQALPTRKGVAPGETNGDGTGDARDNTKEGAPGGDKAAPPGQGSNRGPGGNVTGDSDTPGYDDGTRARPMPLAVLAAAGRRPRLDHLPLGSELLEVDRVCRHRVQTYADGAVQRSLEKAGAWARRKVGNRAELREAIAQVDNALICATLGEAIVTRLGFTLDQLDSGYGDFETRYHAWTALAQRRVAELTSRYDDSVNPDDYVAAQDGDRRAGWAALAAGLTALTAGLLYQPGREAPPRGEYEDLNVPAGLVRGSLALAGGAVGTVAEDGTIRFLDADGNPVDPGGIATGIDALELLAQAGVQRTGWMWAVGAPDRPFEPHQDLDGVEFTTWSDDQLANDGDWPDVGHFSPGDHPGCQCDAVPLLDDTDATGTDETSEEGDA